MKTLKNLATLILAMTAISSSAMSLLDDASLAAVTAKGGSQGSGGATQVSETDALFVGFLMGQQMTIGTLNAEGFVADLAKHGSGALPASLYNGQDVARMELDGASMTIETDIGRLLDQITGHPTDISLGKITITNMTLTGTVLWTWSH